MSPAQGTGGGRSVAIKADGGSSARSRHHRVSVRRAAQSGPWWGKRASGGAGSRAVRRQNGGGRAGGGNGRGGGAAGSPAFPRTPQGSGSPDPLPVATACAPFPRPLSFRGPTESHLFSVSSPPVWCPVVLRPRLARRPWKSRMSGMEVGAKRPASIEVRPGMLWVGGGTEGWWAQPGEG